MAAAEPPVAWALRTMDLDSFFLRYFPPLLIAFWCAVCLVISHIGGWWSLSREYRATSDFIGEKWWFRSCGLRFGCSYNNALIVGADQSGLHLSCLVFLRVGHPPLYIPWHEITAKRERYFFVPVVTLRTRAKPDIPIRFSARFSHKIVASFQGRPPDALVL